MSLEGVDDIESGDSLSLGVLGVGDGVLDNVLEEASEDNSGLVIDEGADSLDTTSSGKSSDGWLGDTEDGVLDGLGGESLGSSLSADLSEFSSLSFSWWHCFIKFTIKLLNFELMALVFKCLSNLRLLLSRNLIGSIWVIEISVYNPEIRLY